MRVAMFTRVSEIPPELWDSTAPDAFYFQRSFLRAMEEGRVEEARYRYLILFEETTRDGGEAVGLAVLTAFTLRLDLLSNDPWIRRLRRISGGLLDVPIICCGIPASFGQHHLHLVREEAAAQAVRCVDRCMQSWAEEEGSGFLFWKEWNASQPAYEALVAEGYVPLPTLPDHRLSLADGIENAVLPEAACENLRSTHQKVDSFLSMLRAPYRRKYRAARALLRGPGPVWHDGDIELQVSPFTPEHASAFHAGYATLMRRTPVKLETYSEAFFDSLARSGLEIRLLRLNDHAHTQSISALLIADRRVLTFILIAKELTHYDAALYSLLLRCIVLLGVGEGFAEVRLGQTSSHAKGSVGALPWRLETLVRSNRRWSHWFLQRFGSTLFPDAEHPRFHVFHEGSRTPPVLQHTGTEEVAR